MTIMRHLDQVKSATMIFKEIVDKRIADLDAELKNAESELVKYQAELNSVPLPSLAGAEDLEFTPYDERSPPEAMLPEVAEVPDQFGSMLGSSADVFASIDEVGENSKGDESAKKTSA